MSLDMLKNIIDSVVVPLVVVLNRCLDEGYFPKKLKIGRTVPVYKKGDPRTMSSYRPI